MADAIPSARRLYGVAIEDPRRERRPSGRDHKDPGDVRSGAQRDRDRILYSAAWRRLGGVTQVITPFEDLPLMHNRLTHSEKVAQVARSIAEVLVNDQDNHEAIAKLGGLDVDVSEAAALAHDLGHPPFGHIGEEILDEVARRELNLTDGFEGNAQTFRILAIGKVRSAKYEGLDLTMATLAATAKYPWTRVEQLAPPGHEDKLETDAAYRRHWRKFSAYAAQSDLLNACREFALVGNEVQTLEASVMDVADDITYAVHDLEDFYLGGILDIPSIRADLDDFSAGNSTDTPFDGLATRLRVDYAGWADREELKEAANRVEGYLKQGFARRGPNFHEREAQARGKGSDLIGRYIAGVKLQAGTLWPDGPHIGLGKETWHEVQVLKEITRTYVVQRPDIALLQRGQQNALERLVGMLKDWVDKDQDRLPPKLRREVWIAQGLRETEAKGGLKLGYGADEFAPRGPEYRAILDYVCGFSDQQCLALFYKLSGTELHRMGSMSAF